MRLLFQYANICFNLPLEFSHAQCHFYLVTLTCLLILLAHFSTLPGAQFMQFVNVFCFAPFAFFRFFHQLIFNWTGSMRLRRPLWCRIFRNTVVINFIIVYEFVPKFKKYYRKNIYIKILYCHITRSLSLSLSWLFIYIIYIYI